MSTATPPTQAASVPTRAAVRAILAAVCVAGLIACVLTYRSQSQFTEAFHRSGAKHQYAGALAEVRASESALYPSVDRDSLTTVILLKLGRPAAAERTARRAAAGNPDDVRAWALLARVQLTRGRVAASRASWRRARALKPDLPARVNPY
jgi:tetratricopeptide (TPR) repeat protein